MEERRENDILVEIGTFVYSQGSIHTTLTEHRGAFNVINEVTFNAQNRTPEPSESLLQEIADIVAKKTNKQ